MWDSRSQSFLNCDADNSRQHHKMVAMMTISTVASTKKKKKKEKKLKSAIKCNKHQAMPSLHSPLQIYTTGSSTRMAKGDCTHNVYFCTH